ncbi:bifunctional metallophosphatase/5'-nucleotidase [Haloparvum sp. PAK95]|uniref:bifunctional metallophosphatase/5'-nucleotidase n=1 Tax=Haloparvum sp. PAK95 TaxID=3418962 RepID=UPI003D2EDD8E
MRRTRRRRVLAAAAGGLGLGALATVPGHATAGSGTDETVTIVHDTHFHGRFADADAPAKTIARYGRVVADLLAAHDNAVFFGNGDDLGPSVLGLEFEGAHMVEALDELAPAAVGVGNHEFDFGVDVATARFRESEVPWVVANLLTPAGEPLPGTDRWTTVDVGGATLGVFGLVGDGFHGLTDYPRDHAVLDPSAAAREATAALRAEHGADLVVAAAHLSSDAQATVAREVDDLDAIVGSHSGVTFEEPRLVGGTVVSEFGDEFDHVGRLTLDVDTGALVDWERVDLFSSAAGEYPPSDGDHHRAVDVATVDPDPDLQAVADDYLATLEERLGQPVVETAVPLNATFENYAVETGLGNLLTDVIRRVGDREVDVAIQHAGGIRSGATYGPGAVTGRDVLNVLPFPNAIEAYELSGDQLRSFLEGSISPLPAEYGAQPTLQVSGVAYEWTGHDGEGTVGNVFVGGEPLDPEETYIVATTDFLAERNAEFAADARVLHTDRYQGHYVKETLEAEYETVAPEREHRLIRVDEDLGAASVTANGDGSVDLVVETTEAVVEPVAGTFRVVSRTGGVVTAERVTQASGAITATFDAAALVDLADALSDPTLRLFGGFVPNDDHYGYEDDAGAVRDLPSSAGYEHFVLKGAVDAAELPDGAATAAGPTGAGKTGETGLDASAVDGLPGFGVASGAVGTVGGAALYARLRGGAARENGAPRKDGAPSENEEEESEG